MSESFGRNKENAFVTSSLSEQTCFVETRSYIEYTDWHGEQIQINESLNKQRQRRLFSRGLEKSCWMLKPWSSKQPKQKAGRMSASNMKNHKWQDSHAVPVWAASKHTAGITKGEAIYWWQTIQFSLCAGWIDGFCGVTWVTSTNDLHVKCCRCELYSTRCPPDSSV